jgi:hypothetical protein
VPDVELTEMVRRYTKRRDDFVARIARVSQQLNEWTDKHATVPPSLNDIARFEAMRAERSRLLSEFTEAEDEFVVQMLQNVGSTYGRGA